MPAADREALLFARLEVMAPQARRLLIAPSRSSLDVTPLARRLVEVATEAGFEARMLDLREGHGTKQSPEVESTEMAVDAASLRRSLEGQTGYTFLVAGGLLDYPSAVVAAAAADAVILAVQLGKTPRQDLEKCREQLRTSAARLLGSALVD